jgi:hypothetical protein
MNKIWLFDEVFISIIKKELQPDNEGIRHEKRGRAILQHKPHQFVLTID